MVEMQVSEGHYIDILGTPSDRFEHVDHRAAVNAAEREIRCSRSDSGIDQQGLAVALDQQAAGAHRHRAVCGEQLGPR
jgi:hypothetical protein